MVADCSACTLTMSLPALMKSATLCSGSTIILQGTVAVSQDYRAAPLNTSASC